MARFVLVDVWFKTRKAEVTQTEELLERLGIRGENKNDDCTYIPGKLILNIEFVVRVNELDDGNTIIWVKEGDEYEITFHTPHTMKQWASMLKPRQMGKRSLMRLLLDKITPWH